MHIWSYGFQGTGQFLNFRGKLIDFTVEDYTEHALSGGSHAKAAAYIEIKDQRSGEVSFGVGVSSNITRATIRALFSAMNRMVMRSKDYV